LCVLRIIQGSPIQSGRSKNHQKPLDANQPLCLFGIYIQAERITESQSSLLLSLSAESYTGAQSLLNEKKSQSILETCKSRCVACISLLRTARSSQRVKPSWLIAESLWAEPDQLGAPLLIWICCPHSMEAPVSVALVSVRTHAYISLVERELVQPAHEGNLRVKYNDTDDFSTTWEQLFLIRQNIHQSAILRVGWCSVLTNKEYHLSFLKNAIFWNYSRLTF